MNAINHLWKFAGAPGWEPLIYRGLDWIQMLIVSDFDFHVIIYLLLSSVFQSIAGWLQENSLHKQQDSKGCEFCSWLMGSGNEMQRKGFSPVFFRKIKNGDNIMTLVFVYVFCLNLILIILLCVFIIVVIDNSRIYTFWLYLFFILIFLRFLLPCCFLFFCNE